MTIPLKIAPKVLLILALAAFGPLIVNAQYFQQELSYNINVELDVEQHRLNAQLELEYTNNSPDTLHFVWMHLWPNAYKDKYTALCQQKVKHNDLDLYFAHEEDRGWIDSLDFSIDGEAATWNYHPEHIDIAKVVLNEALPPGGSISIQTPFRVQVPSGEFSRLGHIGRAYTITQWYPKPAVYDQDGWHPMPYLDQGEFYSEFGTFDVRITLPKNFVVGATGDLVNGEEELAWLDSIAVSTKENKAKGSKNYEPSATTKTLHYHQEKVHDFAWFADMRFHVLKGEVELPSGKKVQTWAMFTPNEADLWMNSIEYINDAVLNYSQWVGEYPYNHTTAVDGTISAGGGMEYPNITVIGTSGSPFDLEVVIAHEVGHNWFYGILGSNERDHAWMDEGLNSYVEARHIMHKYPDCGVLGRHKNGLDRMLGIEEYDYWGRFELFYLYNARRGYDQPIELTSEEFTPTNYGAIVYGKTALVMKQLAGHLGQERFDNCMHAYFDQWKFRHPGPNDLRKVFEGTSGEDLGWVFDDLIGTTKKIDLSLKWQKEENGQKKLAVKNKGKLSAPYNIKNGSDSTIWYSKGTQPSISPIANKDLILSDPGHSTLDINRKNDRIKANGSAGRKRPFQLKTIGGVEDPSRSQLFWSPIVGWNNYNKGMLGAAIYSNVFPSRKLEYVLTPMYSFGTKDLAGSARIAYNFDNCSFGFLQSSRIGITARRYAIWHDRDLTAWSEKVAPFLEFDLKKKGLSDHRSQKIRFRTIAIWERGQIHDDELGDSNTSSSNVYNELSYLYSNKHNLTPYSASVVVLQHEDFIRSSAEFKVRRVYNRKKKSVGFRAFAGVFISEDLKDARHSWKMGGLNGDDDFLYDGVFLGRNESTEVLSQQFLDEQGAFKSPTAFGQSDSWLFALNVDLDIPFPIPVALFADVGVAPVIEVNGAERTTTTKTFYDFGISFPIVRNIFEIWMPLAYSEDIKNEFDFKELSFGEQIRFTLKLELLDPLKFIRNQDP